jgi:hypothetical protein
MTEEVTPVRDILADGETVKLTWQGEIEIDKKCMCADFIATDSRLIYSIGPGNMTSVDYDHISTVTSRTRTEETPISPSEFYRTFKIQIWITLVGSLIGATRYRFSSRLSFSSAVGAK